jgi:hypothetical protein
MQLSFRLDKRPGESHLALDGKKRSEKFGFTHCKAMMLPLFALKEKFCLGQN